MPYKRIKIYGRRYVIAPTLDNMCALEESTGKNLILGVKPDEIDLRFMRSTIENIIECEDGTHIQPDILNRLYSDDIGYAQRIFTECYNQMYHFPNIPKRHFAGNQSSKNPKPLQRILGKRRRDGL